MVAKPILFAVLAVLAGAIPVPVSKEPRFLLDNTVVHLDGQVKQGSDLLAAATAVVDVSGKHHHGLFGREPLLGLGEIGGKDHVVADVLTNVNLGHNRNEVAGLVAGVKAKVDSSLLSGNGDLLGGLHLRDITAFNSINAGLDAKLKHGLTAQADIKANTVADVDAVMDDLLHVKGAVGANVHARGGLVATALADVNTNLGLDGLKVHGAAAAGVETGKGLLHAGIAGKVDAKLAHLLDIDAQDDTKVHLRRTVKADAAANLGLSVGDDVELKGSTTEHAKIGTNVLAHAAGDLAAKVGNGVIIDGQAGLQAALDDLHITADDAVHAAVHGRGFFAHTAGDLNAKVGEGIAVDAKDALDAFVDGLHVGGSDNLDAKVHLRGLLAHATSGLETKVGNGLLVYGNDDLKAAVDDVHLGVADRLHAGVHARDVTAQADAGLAAQLGSTLKTAVQADAGVHLGEGALSFAGSAELKAEIAHLKAQVAAKEKLLLGAI